MAIQNNNNGASALEAVRQLNQSIIGHHNFNTLNADDDEVKDKKKINLDREDLLIFNESPMIQAGYIQTSELNAKILSVLQEIFADVFLAKAVYDTKRGFVTIVSFRYIDDDQFKQKKTESSNVVRCITSSMEPDDIVAKNSIAANILNMVQHQQINNYDASKYAKITKDAKSYLTDLLWCGQDNPKRKWIKNANYELNTQSGTGFNGTRTFTNIIGTVFLDTERVLAMLCGTKEDAGKYDYNIIPIRNNAVNTDSLIRIEKVNKAKKNKIKNKFGIEFQRN